MAPPKELSGQWHGRNKPGHRRVKNKLVIVPICLACRLRDSSSDAEILAERIEKAEIRVEMERRVTAWLVTKGIVM